MASDLPTSVLELQSRLELARRKFGDQRAEITRLTHDLARQQTARAEEQAVLRSVGMILAGEDDDGSTHQLAVWTREVAADAHAAVTHRMTAERRLDLIRRTVNVLGLMARALPEVMDTFGAKQEAARLLTELRAELD